MTKNQRLAAFAVGVLIGGLLAGWVLNIPVTQSISNSFLMIMGAWLFTLGTK